MEWTIMKFENVRRGKGLRIVIMGRFIEMKYLKSKIEISVLDWKQTGY